MRRRCRRLSCRLFVDGGKCATVKGRQPQADKERRGSLSTGAFDPMFPTCNVPVLLCSPSLSTALPRAHRCLPSTHHRLSELHLPPAALHTVAQTPPEGAKLLTQHDCIVHRQITALPRRRHEGMQLEPCLLGALGCLHMGQVVAAPHFHINTCTRPQCAHASTHDVVVVMYVPSCYDAALAACPHPPCLPEAGCRTAHGCIRPHARAHTHAGIPQHTTHTCAPVGQPIWHACMQRSRHACAPGGQPNWHACMHAKVAHGTGLQADLLALPVSLAEPRLHTRT